MVILRYDSATKLFEQHSVLTGFIALEDIITFTIQNTLYLATATQTTQAGNFVYKLNSSNAWELHQNLSAPDESYDVVPFKMMGSDYLVVLTYKAASGGVVTNRIYKWDVAQDSFRSWRTFSGEVSSDVKVFDVDGITYMAVAQYGDNASPTQSLYQVTPYGLDVIQTWSNVGRYDVMEYFQWQGQHFLMHGVFAGPGAASASTVTNSVLYKATACL
jgi:hypothetical protein